MVSGSSDNTVRVTVIVGDQPPEYTTTLVNTISSDSFADSAVRIRHRCHGGPLALRQWSALLPTRRHQALHLRGHRRDSLPTYPGQVRRHLERHLRATGNSTTKPVASQHTTAPPTNSHSWLLTATPAPPPTPPVSPPPPVPSPGPLPPLPPNAPPTPPPATITSPMDTLVRHNVLTTISFDGVGIQSGDIAKWVPSHLGCTASYGVSAFTTVNINPISGQLEGEFRFVYAGSYFLCWRFNYAQQIAPRGDPNRVPPTPFLPFEQIRAAAVGVTGATPNGTATGCVSDVTIT